MFCVWVIMAPSVLHGDVRLSTAQPSFRHCAAFTPLLPLVDWVVRLCVCVLYPVPCLCLYFGQDYMVLIAAALVCLLASIILLI